MNAEVGTFRDLDDLRAELTGNIASLAEFLLGEPNRRLSTRRTSSWGAKGSLKVETSGGKYGSWYDHEAGKGGGPFDLIRHVQGGTFADAAAWARDWLGVPDRMPRPPPPRPVSVSVDEPDPTARARGMWERAGAVDGTLGDRYLREVRKIPKPEAGWPHGAVRYLHSSRSLIFAATTIDGEARAVQTIRLGHDGRKADDGRPAKLSYGPQAGTLVRLPGDAAGPLLLAEGPETGLTAWAATGHETWIALGSVSKLEPPAGRKIVVCADDDRRRATPGKGGGNEAYRRFFDAVSMWRMAGRDVVLVYPTPIRRGDKSDLNDLAQRDGIDAVRDRIVSALAPPAAAKGRVSVAEARARVTKAVAGFAADALAWEKGPGRNPPPAWAKGPDAPVHAVRVTVGTGKSAAMRTSITGLIHDLRAADSTKNVAILCPTHALNDEQADALRKASGLRVEVWRGRDAQDPNNLGKRMCQDLESVKLAQNAGADAQSAVCWQKSPDKPVLACPFFETCGYQAQRKKSADIWLAAHQTLFHGKPAAMSDLGAVVIDESFWAAGIAEPVEFPLDLLRTASADVPKSPWESDHLSARRELIYRALDGHGDTPVFRDAMLETGLTAKDCAEAWATEWRRKIDVVMYPGMPMEARREAASEAHANLAVSRLGRMWKALEALIADGGPVQSGWIKIGTSDDGARTLIIKGLREIAKGWRVPTLLLDAALDLDLVRPYLPDARIVADIDVEAPHQRVMQVIDRAYSQAMLKPLPPEMSDTDEARRRTNRLADLRVLLVNQARATNRRVLAVMQKDVEEALTALGPLPANLDLAHHNGVRGRDGWRDVRKLIVVGRTQPPPNAAASIAESLTGSHVPLLTGWYDRADAIRETRDGAILAEADRHPDPLCETVRRQICEEELLQIIGRARGVNRTAANPVDVLILTDVPLALPIDAEIPGAALAPTPIDKMMAAGGVAMESPRHAARCYPGLWQNPEAAKKAFQRAADLADPARAENRPRLGTFPNRGVLIGECPQPRRVRYQLNGDGQRPFMAAFDPLTVPNPAAWLTERLGPLAWCDIAQPVRDPIPELEPVADATESPRPLDPSFMKPVENPYPAPELAPGDIYRGIAARPPPRDFLTIRGPRGPLALIEVPAFGPYMAAQAAGPLGFPMLMDRPPDRDYPAIAHPAFLPVPSARRYATG